MSAVIIENRNVSCIEGLRASWPAASAPAAFPTLQLTVRAAEKIIGVPLPSLLDIY